MTILLTTLGSFCGLIAAGVVYQLIGTARDARRYPPPGCLVDVGGHRLHLHVAGEGSPVVVLESGIAASSVSWELVWPEVARFTRVCTYDRAGLGWSDSSPRERSLENVLLDLDALLSNAGITGPVVLVGHSFGGLSVLESACRGGLALSGLVLVDPLPASEWRPGSEEEMASLRRGVRLARRGAWLAAIGVVRLSLDLLRAGSRRIPQMAARVTSSAGGSKLTERLVGEVRKLPPSVWPVIQAHWCQPKSFRSMASHLECLPVGAASCGGSSGSLGDLPLIVLSAANSSVSRSEDHSGMARMSTRGRKIVAESSGHWIQLDQPELVVAAIREVVDAARR